MSRCSMCHAAEPVWAGIVTAPKGILLDAPEHIHRNIRLIGRVAAWSNAMPPGNITEMTSEERAILAAYIGAGALTPSRVDTAFRGMKFRISRRFENDLIAYPA